ncbi:MAG: replisome organizer [Patescibacteria group bacterium]|nr:replisome organizer [Patescibacteria group bacterium]
MFNTEIVGSDAFLEMPVSSQALYFHLGMYADDDGFISSPKKILRSMGGSDDDLRILIAKRFVLTFENGVVVIKHWKINNYLRNDRYKETRYLDEKNKLYEKENGSYTEKGEILSLRSTSGIPKNNQRYPSIDKNSIDKNSIETENSKNSLCPCNDIELQEISEKLLIPITAVKEKHERILEMIKVGEFNKKKYKTVYYTLKSWLDLDKKRGYVKSKPTSEREKFMEDLT